MGRGKARGMEFMKKKTSYCNRCKKTKDAEDFPINFAHPYKKLRTCRVCMDKIWDKRGWGLGEVDRKNFENWNDSGLYC